MKHSVVHIEIPAKDPKAAGKFYADLFGWTLQTSEEHDYVMWSPGEDAGPGGGFTTIDGEHTKAGDIAVYVETDDIDATLKKAEGLGAKTAVPRTEIPGMGAYAFFTDPSGNRIALWTSTNG